MKRINKLLLACALVTASANAYADSPSFTYIGAEYIPSGEIEVQDGSLNFNIDASGYAINASAELGIFFIQASRTELESDELFGITAEDTSSTIALGLTFELPQTQIYGLVRGRYDEFSVSAGPLLQEEDDGGIIGGEVGVRVNVTNFLEINANVGKPSTDEGSSYGIGAQLFVTDNLGITVDLRSIDAEQDDIQATFETTSVGLRYTF
jgi:opacity protein-like surface antigen